MEAVKTMTDERNFTDMISGFAKELKDLFVERNRDVEQLTTRGLSSEQMARIMKHKPLSVAIPTEYGGRGLKVKECLKVLETASYESIPLTLIFGINIALFLEPLAKYGINAPREVIYSKFLEQGAMGGLMISEPAHGSDALNMTTQHTEVNGKISIKGNKHWQGLSGDADYWLVASRQAKESGGLGRDISLFVTDNAVPSQHIPLIERYENNGLYPISYGLNSLDIEVPKSHELQPETTGIKMLMDVLHRSRMQFPGMAMGFLKRVLEDTTEYCNSRLIRGNSLLQFDQVKHQLSQLQSAFTICSAMCNRSCEISGVDKNVSLLGLEANTIKARVTDLMQNAAQTMTQLFGASGYKITNLGSRGIMDSRPFQIFEGPNEMLYSQISEAVTKQMQKLKMTFSEYMAHYELTASISRLFAPIITTIEASKSMPQRKHVLLGQAISGMVVASYVERLSDVSFNADLINNTLDSLKQDVDNLINSYKQSSMINPIDNFMQNSNWAM